MNFRYRLMQFMSGRYGIDNLFYIIIGVSMVLSFINLFFRLLILQLIVYGLFIYALFRALSRNLEKRRKENRWATEKLNILKRKSEISIQRRNDKCHVYKKCPSCKAILRLPRRVGLHTTVCPRCSKEFKVRVRK